MKGYHTKDGEEGEAESKAEVTLNKVINWGIENGYGRDYGGEKDMDAEYTINLSYKAPKELIYVVGESLIGHPFLQVPFLHARMPIHLHFFYPSLL